ncbi:MAG: reverse transcriptase family protein [Verrucomicrobiota bacterium]
MPDPRQELYDRIRSSSKDEVILDEMIRLGFWEAGQGQPAMTEEWIRKKGELTRELQELVAKQNRWADKEKLLQELRQQRMAASRESQAETKKRREEERQARAEAWEKSKETDIVYLGKGYSAGLRDQRSDEDKLRRFDLPRLHTAADLARAMELSMGTLRHLAFHRDVERQSHYRRFYLTKKTGGKRLISAPMPRLKAAQHWILEHLLIILPVHEAAHGFVQQRSILSNAQQHTAQDVVINMDLRDFFPSISYPRVRGLFRAFGFSEQISTILALLTTQPEIDEVEMDGESYVIATGERHLPQGAPTSPAITNLLCYRLDRRLAGAAKSLGFRYTRYADDLTFSASGEPAQHVKKLIWRARSIIEDEDLVFHADKLRIMRSNGHQEVTGLTVNNAQPSVPRRDVRRFRTLLYQVEKDGPGSKHWRGAESHLLSTIRGYAHFLRMIDADRAAPLIQRAEDVLRQHGWSHEIRHLPKTPQRHNAAKKTSFWERIRNWFRPA